MAEIEEKQSKAEIDEEDLEAIQTSIYKITGTATYIGECCDIIMSVYKKDSATVMDTCIKPYYASVMTQYQVVSPQEIQDATFFFINFVKECEIKDQMMVYQVCCQFIQICKWTSADNEDHLDVRQNCAYGIGSLSNGMTQETFKTLIPSAMEALEHIVGHDQATNAEEGHLVVSENAYISLGHIALKQTQDPAHVQKFLSLLPLTSEEEAQEAHLLVAEEVVKGNQALLQDPASAKKALQAIKQKYTEDEGTLTEEGLAMVDQALSKV